MATHPSILAWEIPWTEEPFHCSFPTSHPHKQGAAAGRLSWKEGKRWIDRALLLPSRAESFLLILDIEFLGKDFF